MEVPIKICFICFTSIFTTTLAMYLIQSVPFIISCLSSSTFGIEATVYLASHMDHDKIMYGDRVQIFRWPRYKFPVPIRNLEK